MSAELISDFPLIPTVGLNDILIIEQTVAAVTTTHKATVQQLLGSLIPTPEITSLVYDGVENELTITANNLLPNSLVYVDDKPYVMTSYTVGTLPAASCVIAISVEAGEYSVRVENFINKSTDTFTVEP